MRLSAIKLAGFKSFVDPITIIFPSELTGVVGPNGCGKSNIGDAINWVLGEQSPKMLRGKQMADVIFSGSSTRKPVGTAMVELIFDNSEGRLGVDAPEVHVTRRVYRSGEGEYLINGNPCRLRDLKDLFRGTGVGTDAYSLIEQGKVDTLLQATARVVLHQFRQRRLIHLAALALVEGDGVALDVALLGYGHHHILLHDHVLEGDLPGRFHDGRASLIPEFLLDFVQLVLDDIENQPLAGKDFTITGDIL